MGGSDCGHRGAAVYPRGCHPPHHWPTHPGRFIHDWVYSGVFRDVYGEFMIQVNHEYLGFRGRWRPAAAGTPHPRRVGAVVGLRPGCLVPHVDKFYWTHGYVLISKEVEDCVPVFLRHVAHDVYVCGKTINLLKLCCPRVRAAGTRPPQGAACSPCASPRPPAAW